MSVEEEATVTIFRQEKMDNSKRLDTKIYPRGECLWCNHQWQPRKVKKKGEYYYCPNCKRQQVKVWDKKKSLVGEPKPTKAAERSKAKPYKKDGKWYDKDGAPILDLFAETDQIEKEIDKSIQSQSHVVRKGVDTFPEFDSKTVILVYAKAIENGYDEENLSEFIMIALNWYEAIQKVQRVIGRIINPVDFPEEFQVLIQLGLDGRRAQEEIGILERKIESYEKARELMNIHLDNEEEIIKPIKDFDLEKQLGELTNFD